MYYQQYLKNPKHTIMSVKNQQIYSRLTHINEQEEPCLRALRRKIRTLNKKLDDIRETEGKDFLRPEQLQKINRKQKYEQERDKCVDFTVVYREILLQNQDYYRAQQLKQINDLALVLSAMQSKNFRKIVEESGKSTVFADSSKIQTESMTLQGLHDHMKNFLTEMANSKQIKSMAQKYLEEKNSENISTLPKIISWKTAQFSQKKKNLEIGNKLQLKTHEQTKIDEKAQENNQVAFKQQEGATKLVEARQEQEKKQQDDDKGKIEEASWDHSRDMIDENDDESGENNSRQKSEIIMHSKNYEDSQKPGNRESEKKGSFKSADKLEQEKYGRTNRHPAHTQNIKFNRVKRSNQKQKYQQRGKGQLEKNSNQQFHRNQNSDGSDEDSDQPRKFNEEQIKQLEDDGFIVVGKLKPKKNAQSHHSGQRRGTRQRNY